MKTPNRQSFPCLEPVRFHLTALPEKEASDKPRRLSCNKEGQVFVIEGKQGNPEEDWTIGEDGRIQSLHHGGSLVNSFAGDISISKDISKEKNGGFQFILKAVSSDRCVLYCPEKERAVAYEQGSDAISLKFEADMEPPQKMVWRIEFLSGELCFLSNAAHNQRIRCDALGITSMCVNWKGWEVWRFIELGDGSVLITSWTHHKKLLCSDSEGRVYTTEDKLESSTKWTVTKDSRKGVTIRSDSHNRVLSMDKDHHVKTILSSQSDISVADCWDLQPANRNIFSISSLPYDMRLSFRRDHSLRLAPNRKQFEKWHFEFTDNGSIFLFSDAHSGGPYFLAPGDDGILTVSKTPYPWEVEDSPVTGVTFSCDKGFLSCTEDRKLTLVKNKGEYEQAGQPESWVLEQCMPPTTSLKQVSTRTAVVLGAAIAAPFAVVGVIGALGFGAAGVSSGSVAAGMMSAEMVAGGGVMAAGGTVATLQSIGAAGLGLSGTCAAMGAGSVLGGAVIGATGLVGRNPRCMDSEINMDNDSSAEHLHRPFAAWREW